MRCLCLCRAHVELSFLYRHLQNKQIVCEIITFYLRSTRYHERQCNITFNFSEKGQEGMAIQFYHVELTIKRIEDYFKKHLQLKKISGGRAQFDQDFKVFTKDIQILSQYCKILEREEKGLQHLAPYLMKQAGRGDGRYQMRQSVQDRVTNYSQLIVRMDGLAAKLMVYIHGETRHDPTNHEGKKISELLESLAGEMTSFSENISSQQVIEGFKSLFNSSIGATHAEVGVPNMPIVKSLQEKHADPVTLIVLAMYTLALYLRSKNK